MRASALIALASAAVLAAGAAHAQTAAATAAPGQVAQADTSVNPINPAAPPNTEAPAAPYASSDTLGDASKLKAGDPNVVSNGPVPDTPQNRSAYGRPLSNAGKHTTPSGD